MSAAPRISVVLPVYNRAAVLGRCMRSVLAQTWRDLELVVVDDASTDASADVVRTFDDPRIRYVRLPTNGGAGAARNAGIREARGELVAFQDSDDEWLIAKLEQQIPLLADPRVGLVCGGYLVGQESGRPRYIGMTEAQRRGDYELDLLTAFRFITPTWLVRRALLIEAGLFDEKLPPREDWDMAFRLHERCQFTAVDAPVLLKHLSADGIDRNIAARMRGNEGVFERHGARYARHPRLLARHYVQLAKLQLEYRDARTARETLLRSIRLAPPHLLAIGLWLVALGGRRAYLAFRALRRVLKGPVRRGTT